MEESEFISIAKENMITISVQILDSSQNIVRQVGSKEAFQNADHFEEEFFERTHPMLFNLLREFTQKNHRTISEYTGKEIENLYDLVLTNYGRYLACGTALDFNRNL